VLLGPWSFAACSGCHLFISSTARDRLALEPRTLELTMAKKERNTGSAGRARAKRATPPRQRAPRARRTGSSASTSLTDGETEDTAADFARRSDPPREMRPAIAGEDFSPRPMPRPSRGSDLAPSGSMRPMTNPRRSDAVDRGNENIRFEQSEQNDVLRGKRFAEGGEVRGCKAGRCRAKVLVEAIDPLSSCC
jgi:hypothetical protein